MKMLLLVLLTVATTLLMYFFRSIVHDAGAPSIVTVYARNVPYSRIVARVVRNREILTMQQIYPLFDDDPRDGIWSQRVLDVHPMDKINFFYDPRSEEKHAIVTVKFQNDKFCWQLRWFNPSDATFRAPGAVLWDLQKSSPSEVTDKEMKQLPSLFRIQEEELFPAVLKNRNQPHSAGASH